MYENNQLHIEVQLDNENSIGRGDADDVKDILLESAVTTIMDCGDSVAAVDADNKMLVYRNWLGLMRGDLEESVNKGKSTFVRCLNPDWQYTRPDGSVFTLPGRSLLFVRNVGHLMTNPAKLNPDGN